MTLTTGFCAGHELSYFLPLSELRPIHTRDFAPGACSGGTLREQRSSVCTNDFMGILHPREQNFHPAKCSTIFNRLNIWEQAPGANRANLKTLPRVYWHVQNDHGACSGSKTPRVYRPLTSCSEILFIISFKCVWESGIYLMYATFFYLSLSLLVHIALKNASIITVIQTVSSNPLRICPPSLSCYACDVILKTKINLKPWI